MSEFDLPKRGSVPAITFDVGGTLIEPWPSVGHVYAEVAARFGVNGLNAEGLTQSFIRAWKAHAKFDYGRESWFAVVRETFGDRAHRLPAEFFPAVYHRFAEADAWRIYDDVLPTLETLARHGIKLGIISNWDERLRPLLAALKLDRHFASIVVSCEAGATKPDPALFVRAARELRVAPGELLHVGDSHSADVIGAESAGAIGRQLVRGGIAAEAWQVRSLEELCSLAGG
jgi:putative hydrolase of the HAD superfamily